VQQAYIGTQHVRQLTVDFYASVRRRKSLYVLIDESKQADIENLGDCLRVLGDGQTLGDFSLTLVLYADNKKTLDRVLPDVVRIFTSADGSLFSETYNQLNAYFAIVPGNFRRGSYLNVGQESQDFTNQSVLP